MLEDGEKTFPADGRLVRWNVGFALLPFVLTLLGVYLTRSGVTGSVHAFAESPVIGRVLLGAAIIGLVFGIWAALRADRGEPWERVSLLGRETWLAGSAGLVTIALVFVTVGSAYPAYLQVFLDERALVRPVFFVTVLLPLAIVLAVGLAFAFDTRWASRRLGGPKIWWYVIVAVASVTTAVVTIGDHPAPAILLLGLAAATVLVLSLDLARVKPSGLVLAGHLAHIGMALVLVGGAGSSLGEDFAATMGPGEVARLESYTVEVDAIRSGEGDRFIFVAADLTVTGEGGSSFELSPEIRAYEEQALPVPEPALHSTPWEDVVVAISRVSGDASVVDVTVFVRPLVFFVWAGAVLIALAGLVALYATGGDAARRRRSATGELQPTGTTISD